MAKLGGRLGTGSWRSARSTRWRPRSPADSAVPARSGGQSRGGTRGCGEQAEDEQRADDLGGFGRGDPDQDEEPKPSSRTGTPRAGDLGVEAREQQRPGDQQRSTAQTSAAMTVVVSARRPDRPKIEPNSTVTLAAPLPVPLRRVV